MKKAEVWIDTGDDPERKMKADLSSLIREDDNVQFKVTVQCLDPIAQVDKSVKALRRICKPLWSLVVWLGFNGLESIPDSIWELADNLEELAIGYNKYKTISPDIAKLKKLKKLLIGGNPFKDFPEAVCKLEQLELLYAYGCQLSARCFTELHY